MGEHWHQPQKRKLHGIPGEFKTEYLTRGNVPTLVVHHRKEVIDLTLGTNTLGNLVNNWHASDEPVLSDNRYAFFQIGNTVIT
jgi:hypothetical protein